MIRGKLLLCAEGVSIDRQSNNATIFNLIEQLNFKSLPVAYPKLVIFSLFERDDGDAETWDGEMLICINGAEVANPPIPVNFQGKRRSRNILTLGGLPITQPGKMEISIYEKGNRSIEIISYAIEITLPTKPTIEQT